MTEKYFFADPEKPFHFWVREGSRWVLRDGAARFEAKAHPHNAQTARSRTPPSRTGGAD